jgi:hypothetical protein
LGFRVTPAAAPAGAGADVEFEDGTKNDCVVNAATTVNSLTVFTDSRIQIKLQSPLSINNTLIMLGGGMSGFTPPWWSTDERHTQSEYGTALALGRWCSERR